MKMRLILLMLTTGLLFGACQADIFPAAEEPSSGDKETPETPESTSGEAATPEPAENHPPATILPAATSADAIISPTPEAGAQNGIWSAYPPTPGDEAMERGNFFVEAAALLPVAGQPGQAKLWIEGFLPTPCNQPRASIALPDAQNRILVELYSVMPRNVMCAEMIKPFAGQVATLSDLPSGTYSVIFEDLEPQTLVVP